MKDFEFLAENALYFDSACQTLRPAAVIDAQADYFKNYGACGDRTKYEWGRKVDRQVQECRQALLDMLDLNSKEYAVAFTLNTTYGINLILSQLRPTDFKSVITSEIEHNSVFLPSMAAAKKNAWQRQVLKRDETGNLQYQPTDLQKAVVLVNAVSNIDGRKLGNAKILAEDAHKAGGILLLDCAQAFGHEFEFLKGVKFDAAFGSAHKMYGPSLGFVIIRKELFDKMDLSFLGGGMVEDVGLDSYTLMDSNTGTVNLLEPGLQNFSGIIGLNAALQWRKSFRPQGRSQSEHQQNISRILFDGLSADQNVRMVSKQTTGLVTFYSDKIDSHRLAIFLSEQGIMARSGYFCCHYYLKNLLGLPPLLRLSVGLHNTEAQAQTAVKTIEEILCNA